MHRSTAAASGLAVQVRSVSRKFETGVVALDGLNLDVPAGQFVAILGPSGCGKSTLLRLIAGLDKPQGGSVLVAGGNASDRTSVAYVFQDAHLLPWRDVLGNVALPLELMHVPRRQRIVAAQEAIEMVGLIDSIDRYPAELSGGMRMRVSLARAMVTRPRLLLLDEPFAALDEITRQRLDEQLYELWQRTGMTAIFVTHSTSEAVFLAQRAVVLTRRPGKIIEDRSIDLPSDRPASIRATPQFAAQTRAIYEALERGEA
jgi:NitT/TauT family transport system ATP-binding protein